MQIVEAFEKTPETSIHNTFLHKTFQNTSKIMSKELLKALHLVFAKICI